MKVVKKVEFSETEKRAIKNCVETVKCAGVACSECPFAYTLLGCLLKDLERIIENN